MRECDKSKNTYKQQLPIVCVSSNNVGHLITSTIITLHHFTTLHHTSPNYTSLHLSTIRMNYELNDLIKGADIVRFVKSKGMAWLSHVMRMEGKRIPKGVLEWKPTGRRNRGRPRKRWFEDIEEDIEIMGIRGWRKLCKERAEWMKITEKAKTHSGL